MEVHQRQVQVSQKYSRIFSQVISHFIHRLQSRIADLELLNTNFIASKSEDQNAQLNKINVAYIRNVLKKLLETKDREQKRLMINALLTALDSIQSN